MSRSTPTSQTRKIATRLALGVGALIAAALAFEVVAARVDDRRHQPPGVLVTVGEHDLHLHCSGAGSPTVLLEAGAMAFSTTWTHVQTQLSHQTRVCSYDRAGYGWSEPRTARHRVGDAATDLRALLQAAGEVGPYVVVGHSLGGHHARAFVQANRDDVVGLVLVDARHPDAAARLPNYASDMAGFATTARTATILARVGVTRLLGDVGGSLAGLPDEVRASTLARSTSARYWTAVVQEVTTLEELDAAVGAQPPLGDLPVLVLAAATPSPGQNADVRLAWVALQKDLASLSDTARLHVVPSSDHLSLLHHPGHAGEVARAIASLLPDAPPAPTDATERRP